MDIYVKRTVSNAESVNERYYYWVGIINKVKCKGIIIGNNG